MPEKILLPYAFVDDALELLVGRVLLDDVECARDSVVDDERFAVLLAGHEGWQSAAIELEVRDPSGRIAEMLLSGEDRRAASVYAVVNDSEARARWAVPLLGAVEGPWRGVLSVRHRDVRGPLRLMPIATRNCLGEGDGVRATRTGERLAAGTEWSVYVADRPVVPGAAIDNEWCDFSSDPREPLRERADVAWFLDVSNDARPKLLLNEGVKGLKRALETPQRTGRLARVRDALAHSIAQPVLMTLAVEALASATSAELDELGGWQRKYLLVLAGQALNQTEERTVEAWLKAWRNGERTEVLVDIATGVQRHLGVKEGAERLIDALEGAENE